jgi:hypothetical protein
MSGRYLIVEDVAEMYQESVRSVHEKTRLRLIPHRVLPGGRRCLFDPDELDRWLTEGGELETIEMRAGGRIVRLVEQRRASRGASAGGER